VTALGVTAPFWGLVAGLAFLALHGRLRAARVRAAPATTPPS
jgi:predicted benzoate:H+ symporter BenE